MRLMSGGIDLRSPGDMLIKSAIIRLTSLAALPVTAIADQRGRQRAMLGNQLAEPPLSRHVEVACAPR